MKKHRFHIHPGAVTRCRPGPAAPAARRWLQWLAAALWLATPGVQAHTPAEEAAWAQQVRDMALQAAQAALGDRSDLRVQVEVGRLDPRLSLAPCRQVEHYLPPGQKAWGASRVGIRCVDGPTRWNVFLPLTVRVIGPALVLSQNLAAGTVIAPEHLQPGETDWAASNAPLMRQSHELVGRTLTRALAAGQPIREVDLKRRQWFAAGDPVRIVARGAGFSVAADGVAITPGIEGQSARVRTEGGRTVTGNPVAERKLEVPL